MITKLFKTAVFLIAAITLVSCDKDFNEIGTNLVGEDHYGFEKDESFSISSSSYLTGPVQTNGLAVTPFGIYNDPTFGKTTANFVTQVELASVNPTLTDFIDVDSVRLYVPYFSTLDRTLSSGKKLYELDSIFGDTLTTFKIKVTENNYFLREQDIVDNEPQAQSYYNDLGDAINVANAGNPQLNYRTNHPEETTAFRFNSKEIVTYKHETAVSDTDTTIVRTTPGISMRLDKTFFKNKVLLAPTGTLASNNVFKNHFRGLHFTLSDPTPSNGRGVLNMMNFAKGVITIYYRRNITTTSNSVSTTAPRRFELKINLTGSSVGLYNYSSQPTIPTGRLVVKGGQGAISVVDILTAAERQQMVDQDLMINEANLIFHVDTDAMAAQTKKPKRLYLYDMTNGQPIADYNYDTSTSSDTKKSKYVYGGLLDSTSVEGEYDYFYKFRITRYLRDLITKPDSTDVRFGLSVSESVLENAMVNLKQNISVNEPDASVTTYKKLPKASVPHPFGVILHGADSESEQKRLKLVVYYTKPDED